MNVAVIIGSQRKDGTGKRIEEAIMNAKYPHTFDFIRMAELKIEACVACEKCGATGECVLPEGANDRFHSVLSKLKATDAILVITPIYSPYPSRLTALMERLLSVTFFSHEIGKLQRPLLNKRTGIICYGSSKIEDETQLKLLFQKYLMNHYSFSEVNYPYLNEVENPNSIYPGVIEYVLDVIKMM